jgi:hypothetical protein
MNAHTQPSTLHLVLRPLATFVGALLAQAFLFLIALPIAALVAGMGFTREAFFVGTALPTALCIWFVLHRRLGERLVTGAFAPLFNIKLDLGSICIAERLHRDQNTLYDQVAWQGRSWEFFLAELLALRARQQSYAAVLAELDAGLQRLQSWATSSRQGAASPAMADVLATVSSVNESLHRTATLALEIGERRSKLSRELSAFLADNEAAQADIAALTRELDALEQSVEPSLLALLESFIWWRQIRRAELANRTSQKATVDLLSNLAIWRLANQHARLLDQFQQLAHTTIRCRDGEMNLTLDLGDAIWDLLGTPTELLSKDDIARLADR